MQIRTDLPEHTVLKGHVVAMLEDLPDGTRYFVYPKFVDDPGASAWTRGASSADQHRENQLVVVQSWPEEGT